LALFWKDAREVLIQNYSLHHINETVSLLSTEYSWKFTGFYGHPNPALKGESWQLLTHLSRINPSD